MQRVQYILYRCMSTRREKRLKQGREKKIIKNKKISAFSFDWMRIENPRIYCENPALTLEIGLWQFTIVSIYISLDLENIFMFYVQYNISVHWCKYVSCSLIDTTTKIILLIFWYWRIMVEEYYVKLVGIIKLIINNDSAYEF